VNRAAVRILHVEPGPNAGVLERWLAVARQANAELLRRGFADAGLEDVEVVAGQPDGLSFGARLRGLIERLRDDEGVIVVGSGAIPLAQFADFRELADVATSGERWALVNNRYSADVVAIGRSDVLRRVPDLPGDNSMPRWLGEVAAVPVADLGRRARLQMDLDSPLDVLLVSGCAAAPSGVDAAVACERMAALRHVAADRRAELLVAGRTSAATLRWLERTTACRIRALIEERGLRAASPAAMAGDDGPRDARPPRSVLGMLLDERGPGAFGTVVAELADGAAIDTRVLLAHRLGADERRWPGTEDRFASDLGLPGRIDDPWLRELTASALAAPVPILLGGHSLVGPGLRLLFGGQRSR
jgi:hypothetical protein